MDNTISISTFCAWQGVNADTEQTLKRVYRNAARRTYSEWYELLKISFALGNKKFQTTNKSINNA